MTLRGIGKSFGGKVVLRDVNFEFPARGAVAVSGPSGCGKTTLFRILLGLETPDAGEITDPAVCSCVFQEDRLIAHRGARDNLRLVCRDEAAIARALEAAGMSDARDKRVSLLSGGMRRRVSLLRGALYPADALLLDEPFNGLDALRRDEMAAYIRGLWRDKLLVVISHDPEDVARFQVAATLELPARG